MAKVLCSKKATGIGASHRKIAALLSVILLLLALLTSCAPEDFAASKERLENRIENINVQACESLVECFWKWKFPQGYDAQKLFEVEKILNKGFYRSLDMPEIAKEAADCFLRLYYDSISFEDTARYTDALIHCLVMALDDHYAIYRTAEEYEAYTDSMSGSYGGIGITVRKNTKEGTIQVIRLIADSPAQRAGVLVGDMIHSIEGIEINTETMEQAFSQMSGEIGDPVHFTVLRDGEMIPFTIVRENLDNITVSYTVSEEKIAYVTVTSFKRTTYSYFQKAIEAALEAGAIGFVFDVRGNPGGYLSSVMDVLDCLVPEGTELCSYGAENETPTAYVATEPDKIDVPCVVICNGSTASAGELFTAAIRDYNDMGILRATIVGTSEATYGKGIMQSSYHLSDQSVLTITSAFYNPPSGVNYHGVGVIPDLLCTDETAMETARQALLNLIDNK